MAKSAIVIGAGIVGLATARALSLKGYSVTVFERSSRPVGASIRNFGMVWPIGQPDKDLYTQALKSRNIWRAVAAEANIGYDESGSLHLAYHADELQVLKELAEVYQHRGYRLLTAAQVREMSPASRPEGLLGGLFSDEELIVNPREALQQLPIWLADKHNVQFYWETAITDIAFPTVYAGKQSWQADKVFVCSGADFETLYPELYAQQPITKCKLQMLRFASQPSEWKMGPAICGGLSLIHYTSFQAAPSLSMLKKRYQQEMPDYLKWGIHVMASQHGNGEITVGDSHEYALTFDPFDRVEINELILNYLNSFAQFPDPRIVQTWHGIYPKLTNGASELVLDPEPGVKIINGVGGAGMTRSFGLTEEIIS